MLRVKRTGFLFLATFFCAFLALLPAPSQFLTFPLGLYLVGAIVVLALALIQLVNSAEKCESWRRSATGPAAYLGWSLVEGIHISLVLAVFLSGFTLANWLGVTTVLSSESEKPVCLFFKQALTLNRWSLTALLGLAIAFPLVRLLRAIPWRVLVMSILRHTSFVLGKF